MKVNTENYLIKIDRIDADAADEFTEKYFLCPLELFLEDTINEALKSMVPDDSSLDFKTVAVGRVV